MRLSKPVNSKSGPATSTGLKAQLRAELILLQSRLPTFAGDDVMKRLLLLLLRAYQLGLSPYLGANCRFYPTCSEYAAEAIAGMAR